MLASSLQHFRRLHTLILSGQGNIYVGPFFPDWPHPDKDVNLNVGETDIDPYAPALLKEVMIYLGNGCRTLEQICINHCIPGAPFESYDETRLVREEVGGNVVDLRVKKGCGRLIGREEEW
jgi:hypothetical protein